MAKVVKGESIYDCWYNINQWYIEAPIDGAMLMPKRDFSFARYYVTLRSKNMWLPEPEVAPPFFSYKDRMSRLRKRYIDLDIWQEGIDRLTARQKRNTGSAPNTFLIQFHRKETGERGVPAGGGCLVSLNFTWFDKHWHLHILSRASEITARLLADMYFVREAATDAIVQGGIRKIDLDDLPVTWNILLPSQMNYMVGPFTAYTQGAKACKELMTKEPVNPWQIAFQAHFWDEFIWPEKIKWMQRRRWSEKFLRDTSDEIDWRKEWRKYGRAHGSIFNKKKGRISEDI